MSLHVVTEQIMATSWTVEKTLKLRMLWQSTTPYWVFFINFHNIAADCVVKLELKTFQ
jgi:hypothetical protein